MAVPRNRWLALAVLNAGFLMVVLDTSIVNVAMPSIQRELGFSQASLAWVVNAYLIPFGGLLLLAGRLGDLIGRRRMFVSGLGVFTAASLLGGLAQTEELLIGARFLQGVGGAMTSAVILGMIVAMFPERREQAKAIAAYSFVGAAGASIGLILGGVLTEAINWHWTFFINVPIGVVTALAAVRLLAHDAGLGLSRGADAAGAALVVGALTLGVYTIVEAGGNGWTSATTLGLGALAVGLLVAFVVREARAATPLVPLRLIRTLSAPNVVQVVMITGLFGQQFVVALYLQNVLGFGALGVGLAMVPIALAVGVFSLGIAARAIMRFGARAVLLTGLALIAVGLLTLGRAPVHGEYAVDVLPALVLMGIGAGLALPSITTLAMADAVADDAGLASGLTNTTQQVGAALGVAVLLSLATSRSDALLAAGDTTAAALAGGYRLAFSVAAGLVMAAGALAVALLRPAAAVAPEPVADCA